MLAHVSARLHTTIRFAGSRERGDVPGWVMITIMTAGLVAVLWQFAGPYLTRVLESALEETVGVN